MGLLLSRKDECIEKVFANGFEVSLVAVGDGTEVIHHRATAGARWVLSPEDAWPGMECAVILSGSLLYKSGDDTIRLGQGDKIIASHLAQAYYFEVEEATEFVYVASRPVFHMYSSECAKLQELAVELEHKDGYTADHCQRIMSTSMKVGQRLGFSAEDLHLLNLAAFLHDVGKLNIPQEILNKPGPLTPDEWEIMKRHTTYGREILETTRYTYLRAAAPIVEQHHERFDGSGYPYGRQGDEIPLQAAIIAAVDSYDAMTSDRVYKRGIRKDDAIRELEALRGTWYHPLVVDTLTDVLKS